MSMDFLEKQKDAHVLCDCRHHIKQPLTSNHYHISVFYSKKPFIVVLSKIL